MGAYTPSDGGVQEFTSPDLYDPAYARCAMGFAGGPGEFALSGLHGYGSDYWWHGVSYCVAAPDAEENPLISFYSAGTEVFRVTASGTLGSATTIKMYYWSGSGFVLIGGAGFTISKAVLNTLDFHLNSTTAEAYCNGTLRASGTATMTAVANIDRHSLLQPNGAYAWSEMIVADQPTITYRLKTLPITANGTNTDWTGSYTDVDEIIYNDGTFISEATANKVSTFAIGAPTITGTVQALVVTSRTNAAPGGPQHVELAVKSGATTYFSASQALGLGYSANVAVWMTDPNGSAPWTPTTANAVEYGVKSIA
jgi:hypothetical protein